MASESSLHLQSFPEYPQELVARFPEMRNHQIEVQRWLDQVSFTLLQEFNRLGDRIRRLESKA